MHPKKASIFNAIHQGKTISLYELKNRNGLTAQMWETRLVGRSAKRVNSNHDPPQTAENPIPAFEADLTMDESYSQLPLIDYYSQ